MVDKLVMEQVCIRRDLPLVATILQVVAEKQAKEIPPALPTKNIPYRPLDENVYNKISELAPILADNGFLRKIAEQHDFNNWDCYHITWKGQCFLDLFDYCDALPPGCPTRIAAEIALISFH